MMKKKVGQRETHQHENMERLHVYPVCLALTNHPKTKRNRTQTKTNNDAISLSSSEPTPRLLPFPSRKHPPSPSPFLQGAHSLRPDRSRLGSDQLLLLFLVVLVFVVAPLYLSLDVPPRFERSDGTSSGSPSDEVEVALVILYEVRGG